VAKEKPKPPSSKRKGGLQTAFTKRKRGLRFWRTMRISIREGEIGSHLPLSEKGWSPLMKNREIMSNWGRTPGGGGNEKPDLGGGRPDGQQGRKRCHICEVDLSPGEGHEGHAAKNKRSRRSSGKKLEVHGEEGKETDDEKNGEEWAGQEGRVYLRERGRGGMIRIPTSIPISGGKFRDYD